MEEVKERNNNCAGFESCLCLPGAPLLCCTVQHHQSPEAVRFYPSPCPQDESPTETITVNSHTTAQKWWPLHFQWALILKVMDDVLRDWMSPERFCLRRAPKECFKFKSNSSSSNYFRWFQENHQRTFCPERNLWLVLFFLFYNYAFTLNDFIVRMSVRNNFSRDTDSGKCRDEIVYRVSSGRPRSQAQLTIPATSADSSWSQSRPTSADGSADSPLCIQLANVKWGTSFKSL